MTYPLVAELADAGIPVTVSCRVLKLARQPYYRWRNDPIRSADVLRAHRIAVAADELLRTVAPPFFSDGSLRDRRSDLTRRPCLDAYVYARGLRRRARREAPARWGQMRRLPALARPGAVANDNAV